MQKEGWWKQDFSKDFYFFFNLTWICFLAIEAEWYLHPSVFSCWYIVLSFIVLSSVCLIGLFVSFFTWKESKKLQEIHNEGE